MKRNTANGPFVRPSATRLMPLLWGLLLLVMACTSPALSRASGDLTLSLPLPLLQGLLKDALPLEISRKGALAGSVWIDTVEDLSLGADTVSFLSRVRAKDVTYTLDVGKKPMVVTLGSLQATLDTRAAFRYAPEKNTLFLRLDVRERGAKENPALKVLAGLLKQQEIPIELDGLDPLKGMLGRTPVRVDFSIRDVTSTKDMLLLRLKPTLTKGSAKPVQE